MYSLPTLYNFLNGKTRTWSIHLQLKQKNGQKIQVTSEDMKVPVNSYCEYFTRSGYKDMKITQSAATIISTGKNIGKKNETNVLTQTLKDIQSKFNKKLKEGYTETEIKKDVGIIPYPMALKTYKDHGTKLIYPLYVQPKLDGIRVLAFFKDNEVHLYTRRLHEISGFTKLRSSLKAVFVKHKSIQSYILDGELYSHGMNLQLISGLVRNDSISEQEKEKLSLWLFDMFDIANPKEPFESRMTHMKIFESSSYVTINETQVAETIDEADLYYDEKISEGYEGIIYKSMNKPYEFCFNKEKRSQWYLKRKKQFDSEFEIVDFTEGQGKDSEAIIFILKTKNNVEFHSVPNGTYGYRQGLYQQALNDFTVFKGKFAKVQYEDISVDGVPLRNRMIMIRDLDFD